MFLETGDAAKSQGWSALILDTNGNGKRDEGYTEGNTPIDPTKDRRITTGFYAVMPSPIDNSVWGSYRAPSRRGAACCSWRQSAGNDADGNL